MTSPAAAFAGLLNSGNGLAVGVLPLLQVTAEEEEEEEEPMGSRPSNTFLLITVTVPCEEDEDVGDGVVVGEFRQMSTKLLPNTI